MRVEPSGAWNPYRKWSVGVLECRRDATCYGFFGFQARHEMGAPMELFAGAKRGREKVEKVRTDQGRKSSIVRFLRVRPSGAWNQGGGRGIWSGGVLE